jgi:hypothetical protein
MSAPQATTDTNDILPGLCECLGAESGAATRLAREERRAGGVEADSRCSHPIRRCRGQAGERMTTMLRDKNVALM